VNFKISLLSGALLLAPILADASIFFTVKGYAVHNPNGTVTYHYSVTNNSWTNVVRPAATCRFEIGRAAYGNLPEHEPELTGLPPTVSPRSGMLIYGGNGVLAMTAPAGWKGTEGGDQEHIRHTLVWTAADSGSPTGCTGLLPGQTLTGLSATRAEANPTYLGVPKAGEIYSRTHYVISTNDGVQAYGLVEAIAAPPVVPPVDTLPPTLSVTLSPNTLKPNEKLVPITATITVKDDYDPAPEIKLESIVANEPLEKEDIKDAQIGTDDRLFKLKAEREGQNKAGRIYTVTYSATDGSGNKAIATATVTVAHDERKTDD